MALPFPKREGEVECEALSSSPREHWQSNNIGADDAETPASGHAETVSDKQSTDARNFHIAASACNIMAGCCEQFSIPSGYQSMAQQNGPTTCNAASKRKARSEGPRPRGPSGAAGKNCSGTSNFQPGMHPATEFQNLGHPQTHLRITDCKYLRPFRHPFWLILSEIKVLN